ncbi:MAG: SUMF1/EgtB/PvdO family nonheme iron enzyme [Planctomycetes bacterium]|nr:SUMF1/EgtB/PvdO family nonheme iron enzyme [Planctomycetota bacterium]
MSEPTSGHLDALRRQIREAKEEELARLRSACGPRAREFLLGLRALEGRLVTKTRFLECAADWFNDLDAARLVPDHPVRDIGSLLRDAGGLTEDALAELRKAVEIRGSEDLAVSPDLRRRLLELQPPPELHNWLVGLPSRKGARRSFQRRPREERYELGPEIARGGLGRIVEAHDRHLKREVAIKLVRDETYPDISERFVREAELAARLDHPHIIPVYDFDAMPGPAGSQRLFLCMKRVRGQNLAEVIRRVSEADPSLPGKFSRARLLRIFQDICLGIAYAHSKGVIHRDLKPSNVMIGDYGETLIVDWGLARNAGEVKAAGGPGEPPPEGGSADAIRDASRPDDETALTLDGEVMGTPAYMPPEQAGGRREDVDRRSDIFALGGILFTILTWRPPFEGTSREEVLGRARSGRVEAPSERARIVHGGSGPCGEGAGARIAASPEPIPPELDEICLKALAFRKEDRYQTATELHDEVQLFLEGVKERERNLKEARERVEKGHAQFVRYRALRGEIEAQERAVREWDEKIEPHGSPEQKRPLWDAEARLRALREERIGAFSQASAEFGQALAVDPANVEASDGKCELFLDRFLEAEKRKDQEEMLLNRNMLLQEDRRREFRAKLDAPGALSLRTFAYECDCLRPVRHADWRLEISEKPTLPWCDGRPRADRPLGDRDCPVPEVKTYPEGVRWGHAETCRRREVTGVGVFISKYEERDKRLVLGEERRLGVTPLADAGLPQGSYLCTLRPQDPAWAEVRLPVLIPRGGRWDQDVSLYRAGDIPAGFRLISGGPFTFGGAWAGGGEVKTKRTEDLFVATFPVTCAEYLEFLCDLCASGNATEACRRQPREVDKNWWIESGGRFRLPTAEEDRDLGWDPRWPVFGVSWSDAVAYAAWRSRREGIAFRLMHEEEWEKAARGVDGRVFSYGDFYDGSYSHTNVSVPGKLTPRPVGSFPIDESAWGIRDLSGGVQTWCWNSPHVPYRDLRSARGGAWSHDSNFALGGARHGDRPRDVYGFRGLRLAAATAAPAGI